MADHDVGGSSPSAATGLLLLGGASERFGSPKALALFRGEPLAERAHRVLREAFDEVLALGKADDAFELSFPVIDDGVDERAPLFGLLAGLRLAAHEACVALPVDCPLVTPTALQALAEAGAVPQTGPLPGAYPRSLVPALEERIAGGELSLRGVNANVLELDPSLLLNVNTRMELIEAAVVDWAREREDVQAVVVAGSRARLDAPADRWSDLDVLLVVEEPRSYALDPSWVEEFGTPVFSFVERTLLGQLERRVLYETGEDVDFALLPPSILDELEAAAGVGDIFRRGYRLLVDRIGVGERLARLAQGSAPPPSQDAFDELAADFWYHALWVAKKLRRGEVFTALDCLDGYMKARVVTLMAWHARALDPSVDTWHAGRFLERWADPGALSALEGAYARYELRDVARALWSTIGLFQGLEEETAGRLGLRLALDHADLRRRVAEIVPDPRPGSTLP